MSDDIEPDGQPSAEPAVRLDEEFARGSSRDDDNRIRTTIRGPKYIEFLVQRAVSMGYAPTYMKATNRLVRTGIRYIHKLEEQYAIPQKYESLAAESSGKDWLTKQLDSLPPRPFYCPSKCELYSQIPMWAYRIIAQTAQHFKVSLNTMAIYGMVNAIGDDTTISLEKWSASAQEDIVECHQQLEEYELSLDRLIILHQVE